MTTQQKRQGVAAHTTQKGGDKPPTLFYSNLFKTHPHNLNMTLKHTIHKSLYTSIIKPVLFQFDPEKVHNSFLKIGKTFGSNIVTKKITSVFFNYQNKALEQDLLGIHFRNPVGLSAGFDKNAEMISIMEDVGFGFVEVGSITAKPYGGNPGVRLKRIPEKKSIWVNMGLNNKGAHEIHSRLSSQNYKIPFGVSIAKTNCKETADDLVGVLDYLESIKIMKDIGNYITINISCPNAFGGQPFSRPEIYEKLLIKVDNLKITKPIFVKLSPNLTKKNIDQIINISSKHNIQGFICSNLHKDFKNGSGGFSGMVVKDMADDLLSYVYKKTKGKFILVGVGGIFSAEDAYDKIKRGASLLQLITGMIYKGPSLIGEINHGLVKLLKSDGFTNISEAVGSSYKKAANK